MRGEYPIIDMFQYPTVAEFARFLENRPADSDARRGAVDRARKQWAFFGQSRRPGGRSL